MGSVDMILDVASTVKGIGPCIDFGHVHARSLGGLEWPDAMGKFVPMVAGKVVVPGHGDLLDDAAVKTQADEIAAVAEITRGVLSGAISEDEGAGKGPYPPEVMLTAFGRARSK